MNDKVKYRPEIDGLRAVAVLSVVLYHAQFLVNGNNLIPGGFIGVDVFFVLSGYLISLIILRELDNGEFSSLNFYGRRVRRILPILLCAILASLPFAWNYLLPSDFIDFSYQIISSIFFSSNFYFAFEDSYWAADSSLKPLLHTWSLGVEEQFYLLMPFLLVLLYKYQKKYLLRYLVAIGGCSLAYAQWFSQIYPEHTFFLLPGRAWELLAGACLSVIDFQGKKKRPEGMCSHFPSLGLLLIIISFFVFDKGTQHPSLLTFIPVLGAVLIIYFANDQDLSIQVLRSKLFVSIGVISYGVYIWHFPVFAFNNIVLEDKSDVLKLASIIVVLSLSVLTYFLIERPFRQAKIISDKVFYTGGVLIVVLVSSMALFGLVDGFKERVPAFVNQPAKPKLITNHEWFMSKEEHKGSIILVGDSHMNAIAPTLRKTALALGYHFANSGFNGCQLILEADRVSKRDMQPGKCSSQLQSDRLDFIVNSDESFVVLGGRLPLIMEEDRFDNKEGAYEGEMTDFMQNSSRSLRSKGDRQGFIKEQYSKTVSKILEAGHTVVLIYPVPEVGWHVPKTLLGKIRGDLFNARKIVAEEPVTTSYEVFQERTRTSYEVLDSISHENIIRVYPENLFCNTLIGSRCVSHDLENTFYRDDDHLSDVGASLLVGKVISSLKNKSLTK